MRVEPQIKRTVAFVDGQNLYHAAREAFGQTHPSYDVTALAKSVCKIRGWTLSAVRFYTGVPDPDDNAFWNHYWHHKLAAMGRQGVTVFSRPLRYRNKTIRLPGGGEHTVLVGEEKGIDVRLAIDTIRMAHCGEFDVALIFSQDQDLSEVAREVRVISQESDRWMKVVSAFPLSPTSKNRRGIDGTDWIRIDREMYEACLDSRDYRAKSPPRGPAV